MLCFLTGVLALWSASKGRTLCVWLMFILVLRSNLLCALAGAFLVFMIDLSTCCIVSALVITGDLYCNYSCLTFWWCRPTSNLGRMV